MQFHSIFGCYVDINKWNLSSKYNKTWLYFMKNLSLGDRRPGGLCLKDFGHPGISKIWFVIFQVRY